MSKSLIIIGSGIAGLSAGIYAQKNGYSTTIYEMQKRPGGLCTAWTRRGYTFDGCIHWLAGSDPASSLYHLWEETGAIEGRQFYHSEYFFKLRDVKGRYFTLWNDPYKLRAELVDFAPEDEKTIIRLSDNLRTLMINEMPTDFSIWKLGTYLNAIRILFRYRMDAAGFADKFKNPVLKKIITENLDWHGMSMAFSLWAMSLMAKRHAGYPMGGSRLFMNQIAKKYEDLGGKIVFNAKVEKILVENNKAVGIRLAGGEEKRSDIVLSAADGHSTLYDWLDGKYNNAKINKLYSTLKPFPPLILVYLGITGHFNAEYHDFTFMLTKPLKIAEKDRDRLSLRIFNFDKSLAPPNGNVFMVMMSSEMDYWNKIKDNRSAYIDEKDDIIKKVVYGLGELYPDIEMRVEAADVVTPITFVEQTGNWNGSYQGWVLDKKSVMQKIPQTLKGLEDFYMAGQWTSPGGGLPSGVITARNAVKMMCKADKKKFTP